MAPALALLVAALALAACKRQARDAPAPLRIAAAADLAFAFGDLGKTFQDQTGQPVTFSFGSTGQLAKQIREGAPFDLFAAANVSFVNDVVKAGACDPATQAIYARGRIAVWTPENVASVQRIDDLAEPRFRKIAIANPDHAPYGRAAKEALETAGIWDQVAARIVYGENVQQALKFAQSGNTEAAIVALSLASVSKNGGYLPVPEELHHPIDQALIVCRGGGNASRARDFAAFVGSSGGRAVMRRYGFILPGETALNAP